MQHIIGVLLLISLDGKIRNSSVKGCTKPRGRSTKKLLVIPPPKIVSVRACSDLLIEQYRLVIAIKSKLKSGDITPI